MPTILQPPAQLRAAAYAMPEFDAISSHESAYTGAVHRLDWGGGWWRLEIDTPPLDWDEAAEVLTWASLARRPDVVVELPPPPMAVRRGTSAAATLTVSQAAAAQALGLWLAGIGAGATLGAGTFLRIGDHLHRVDAAAAGDAAFVQIFPRLRLPAAQGSVVQVGAVKGRWALLERPSLRQVKGPYVAKSNALTLRFAEAL